MNSPTNIVLRVAAKAVIVNDEGCILILREAPPALHSTNTRSGRYQLPGGQLEIGEVFEDCLRREVFEETGLEIEPGEPLLVGEWRPVINGEQRQIIGIFVAGKTDSKDVQISDEHDDYQWIDPAKRASYDIVDPDWQAIDEFMSRLA